MRSPIRLMLCLLAALPIGCGTRGGSYDNQLAVEGPLGAANYVVALNRANRALLVVDPSGATPEQAFRLPSLPRNLTLTPDGLTALVATGDSQAPGLTQISLQPGHLGTRKDFSFTANPDVVHVSPDGRFVLLTYAQESSNGGILNPNEVVVVDLEAGGARRVALGTDSPLPRQVVFAPPGHGGTQLVAVLFDKGLALFDLGAESPVLRVPVRSRGGPDVTPLRALFSAFEGGSGYLFVLASQSDDVIAVSLSTLGTMTASINFLAGGKGLADIAFPAGPPPTQNVLALYSSSREAYQLDARGLVDHSVVATLDVAATHLMPVPGGLVMAIGDSAEVNGASVFAWDPASGKTAVVTLDGPYLQAYQASGAPVAVFSVGSGANAELDIVTTAADSRGPSLSVSPILLAGPLAALIFDPAGTKAYFSESNSSNLFSLDLGTLAHQLVNVGQPVTQLGIAPGWIFGTSPGGFYPNGATVFGTLVTAPTSFDQSKVRSFPDYTLANEVGIETGH